MATVKKITKCVKNTLFEEIVLPLQMIYTYTPFSFEKRVKYRKFFTNDFTFTNYLRSVAIILFAKLVKRSIFSANNFTFTHDLHLEAIAMHCFFVKSCKK